MSEERLATNGRLCYTPSSRGSGDTEGGGDGETVRWERTGANQCPLDMAGQLPS